MNPLFQLPDPRTVDLGSRGSTRVWDSATNADTAPLLLIHGWNVDAPTNYGYAFPHLSRHHRVVMFDIAGHGHGPRCAERFTIEAAAADGVAVLDALDIEQAVICGYSLGGAIALTLLRDRPDRCAGILLSATAATFAETRRESAQFRVLHQAGRALRHAPPRLADTAFSALCRSFTRRYPNWVSNAVSNGDPVSLFEAGASLATFNAQRWVGPVEVPSAFVATARDSVVPLRRQVDLAETLAVDAMHNVDSNHDVPIRNNDEFHDALCAAAASVTSAAGNAQDR